MIETEDAYSESGVLIVTGGQAPYGMVDIDGDLYPLAAPIGEQNLSVFQGKNVVGDYQLDSDPLLSTWIWSDGSGGQGVAELNVVSDPARYFIGTWYPRHPKQIGNGFRVRTLAPAASVANGDIRFLADMKVAGFFTGYYTIDDELYDADETSIGTLTAEPTGKAAVFKGLAANEYLVIPMGASGYATLMDDGSTFANVAADATHPAAISVQVWDNKLIALDVGGRMWFTTDLTGDWTPYDDWAQLPRAETGRRLVPFFDRNIGAPAVFCITDTAIYQFDAAQPALYPVDAGWPPHPDHGLAATKHDGDLFISVGMGVHRYTNGSFLAMGLDQRDGLPIEYQGAIVDLVTEQYTGMFALVGKGTDYQDLDWRDESDTTAFRPSLHVFTSMGWHVLWEGDEGQDAVRNSMFVSRNNGTYRLYWGVSDDTGCALKYIDLPRTWATPNQRLRVKGGFSAFSYGETGWYDAGMEGYRKMLSALKLHTKGLSGAERITVFYKIDDDDNAWAMLGATTRSGRAVFQFGDNAPKRSGQQGVFSGAIAERWKYRVEFESPHFHGITTRYLATSYLKLVNPSDAWKMTLDLNNGNGELSAEELWIRLKLILSRGLLVPLTIGTTTKRVLLSQISRTRNDGLDPRAGIVPLSVLEIPTEMDTFGG
jgi:hypothetical protein